MHTGLLQLLVAEVLAIMELLDVVCCQQISAFLLLITVRPQHKVHHAVNMINYLFYYLYVYIDRFMVHKLSKPCCY